MATRKNSSERLERALSRYNLEALPDETKKMLEETMSRGDFDPDKLAEAIEREEESRKERCPWYVAISRILGFLLFAGGLLGFFCAMLQIGVRLFDKISGANLSEWIIGVQNSHPVAFYCILAIGVLLFLGWVASRLGEAVSGGRE